MSVIRKTTRRLGLARRALLGSGSWTRTNSPHQDGPSQVLSAQAPETVDRLNDLSAAVWQSGSPQDVERLAAETRRYPVGTHSHVHGSLALARWHLHTHEVMQAMEWLEPLELPDARLQREVDLLRADCLCELGEGRAALRILSRMVGNDTSDPDLVLRAAHARHALNPPMGHESGPLLDAVNRLYQHAGFSMIRRASTAAPTSVNNLACGAPEAEPRERLPLVSVVTWMQSATDLFALQSLVDQSWKNLEILVLTGGSALDDLAATGLVDTRIRVVEADGSTGHPLVIGSRHATGEFINLHPPGSWAHPQRIEAQASALLSAPDEHANVCGHVVVHRDLRPRPLGRTAGPHLVGANPHAAMLRMGDRTPNEIMTAYRDAILSNFSEMSGLLQAQPGIGLTSKRVPLTLSTRYMHATELASTEPSE